MLVIVQQLQIIQISLAGYLATSAINSKLVKMLVEMQ
jgi:hypothetical protein